VSAGTLLAANQFGSNITSIPQLDTAVGPNFERFDGLDVPADHPAGTVADGGMPLGASHGTNVPRPGQLNQPEGQVYTPGPLRGLVNTVDGQPLKVGAWQPSEDNALSRGYTRSKTPSIQHRLGDGQNFGGLAQTVILSEISDNPPVPGDLTSILAGQS
jgi:hypothetical protein